MSKSEIAQGIGLFLLIGLIINGCVHSCKKHKDDPEWLQNTPIAVYRGVEFFWHDDFAGVDWKERVSEDINTSIRLFTGVTQTYDLVNTKQQIEDFSKQLLKYPTVRRKEIAHAVRMFLQFGDLWTKDVIAHLEGSDSNSSFEFSPKAKRAYDSLMNYYYIAEMKDFQTAADSLINDMIENPENKQIYITRLKGHDATDIRQYEKYFYKIFKESLWKL